jgi:hypothetical protein
MFGEHHLVCKLLLPRFLVDETAVGFALRVNLPDWHVKCG